MMGSGGTAWAKHDAAAINVCEQEGMGPTLRHNQGSLPPPQTKEKKVVVAVVVVDRKEPDIKNSI